MDLARLNFSHGTHESHAYTISLLREAAARKGRPLAIIQDLQGPKIRTGGLKGGKTVWLRHGELFTITTRVVPGTTAHVSTTYKDLPHDLNPGDRVLVSDGLIELRVLETTRQEVKTEVVVGGELRENQGINLPCVNLSTPSLTDKDIEDLHFGLAQGVDYVALSFVRRAADIDDIRRIIGNAGQDVPVIAKIEKPEALDELPEVLKRAGGLMVARGDLGVEIPTEQVPLVQKKLIDAANDSGVPVITATQMLDSMIRNPRPTRAEASDVANAIIDGTDAVMLSGETANGKYPVEAVQMMSRIATTVESSELHSQHEPDLSIEPQRDVPRAITEAARAIVEALPSVQAIAAFTVTGRTACLMSRLRPSVPVLAFTPRETIYRRINLLWGVIPVLVPEIVDHIDTLRPYIHRALVQHGILREATIMVVVIGGDPFGRDYRTNFIRVTRINPDDDLDDDLTL